MDTGTSHRQLLLAWLSLKPLLMVINTLLFFNAITAVPRYYMAIKLIRMFHILKLDFVGDAVGHYSGLTKRLLELYPDLLDEE